MPLTIKFSTQIVHDYVTHANQVSWSICTNCAILGRR